MTNLKHIWMLGVFSLLFSFTVQAHNGHRNCKKKKRIAATHSINRLPAIYKVIPYKHVKYYKVNNHYYIGQGGKFIVVTPPRSVLVIK